MPVNYPRKGGKANSQETETDEGLRDIEHKACALPQAFMNYSTRNQQFSSAVRKGGVHERQSVCFKGRYEWGRPLRQRVKPLSRSTLSFCGLVKCPEDHVRCMCASITCFKVWAEFRSGRAVP